MKEMKRIALVHHVGELGGGTKSLIDMALMLCECYEVVICVPKGKLLEVGIQKENVSIHEIKCVPFLNFFSGSSPLLSKASMISLKSIFRIKDFCDEIDLINPDLILFNTIVASVASIKINNRACAFIDRETMTKRVHVNIYNKIIGKNIKGAAFLCKYEREKFLISEKVVSVIIPDCVPEGDLNVEDFETDTLSDYKYKVLFMGGSSRLKGVDIALEAITKTNSSIALVVAGHFDLNRFTVKNILTHIYNPNYCMHLIRLRRAYKRIIKRENVLFVGAKANIYPLINNCDIVIFPSSKVHQPRPCIEAGYFKKPVIISDFKETEEYFIKGFNALTFAPNDPEDLARCIQYASEHQEEMEVLGEHNYEMSMRFHNYEKVKKDLNSFVDMVIG